MKAIDPAPKRFSLAAALLVTACGGAAAEPRPQAAPPCMAIATAGAPVASSARSAAGATPMLTATSVESVAKELVKRINAQDGPAVVALFGPSMAKALPIEKAGPFVASIIEYNGRIVSVERVPDDEGQRHGKFSVKAERGELRMEIDLDQNDKVSGMTITNAPAAEPPVVKSTIPLALPFRGQWLTFWGGDTLAVNQHVAHRSQRRAADLVMVDSGGTTHRGDGKKNDDYLAYGQDILAVAEGTVIMVIDGVPENIPGEMNPSMLGGNTIIVKHSDTLYSLYSHLQPGKQRVKVGAKVKQGAVLGACGNSGNSSEPHLHFQLQDGPRFEKSWGVEPVFKNIAVTREGKSRTDVEYTWMKGDLVGALPKK